MKGVTTWKTYNSRKVYNRANMSNLTEDTIRQAADTAVDISSELQAEDIRLMDVRGISDFADYFVLMTTQSPRHMRAVRDEIEVSLKTDGVNLHHREGDHTSGWALLDYGDLVIHMFSQDFREFYDLESAWTEARTLSIIQ